MFSWTRWTSLIRRQPRWRLGAAVAALALVLFFALRRGDAEGPGAITFATRRGPLDISVLEGGSLQALESQEIKCEVRVGYNGIKILKIVEEGYQVSDEDIRTNRVLVELDSSDLQKQLAQQEIQYQSAAASLTDAQQGYDIQLNQNLSDIKAAEQKSRFARLDFEKFLGDQLARSIIDELGLDREIAAEEDSGNSGLTRTNEVALSAPAHAASTTHAPAPPPAPAHSGPGTHGSPTNGVRLDFSRFARLDVLGDGEAKQKIRELEDALQVAKKEEGQARVTLEGTKRLADRSFLTSTDLQRDEIAYENSRLKVQKAETARDLYQKYEFIKAAEESLSKYAEAMRELNRARKAAISKLAQAEAKLKSAQAQYEVQARQRKELDEQLQKCVITAKKPGLVVYGGGDDDRYWYGGEERIREGATVRERQSIITIPDMTRMGVKVKIHESYIKKVKKGLKARITVDAFPDQVLTGEVTKVGVLPDSMNRWMNPDLKVYLTTIAIDGTASWLKPGMTAKVEIQVDRLPDAIYVPVQAVQPKDGKQVCYLARGRGSKPQEVEIGQFNDEFIEIKKGLQPGDLVLLRPPEAASGSAGEKQRAEEPGPEPESKPSGAKTAGPSTPAKPAGG